MFTNNSIGDKIYTNYFIFNYLRIFQGVYMNKLSLDISNCQDFVSESEPLKLAPYADLAKKNLFTIADKPGEFTGWINLPTDYDKEEFDRVLKASEYIRQNAEVLVVIGIGGSYLGARAVIEALKSNFSAYDKNELKVVFAGNNISPTYLQDLIDMLKDKDFCLNVISKSGTTTEPAIAFRILKNLLEKKYGKQEAKKRIFATTDRKKGALKTLADKEGYETFVVPDEVGGRYSVLTAVGLLPIAAAGLDIKKLMQGAADAQKEFAQKDGLENDALKYAIYRNILYRKGKSVEILVNYEPSFMMFNEWFKQLYGESEGKDQKGIYPSSVIFSTDLHSLGQFIQDGSRIMFETVIKINQSKRSLTIPSDSEDLDGLNYIAGKDMYFVQEKAMKGTILAHVDGAVPNLVLNIEKNDEYNLGYMIYFFEFACAVSGYMNGVNPFDQEGVESYKKNMFALLGKKGYEDIRENLEKRLQS